MMPVSTGVPRRVYGQSTSGNCHKVRLACDILKIPYRWHEVDIMEGTTRTPQYLAMNPNGKVPLLQVDDRTYLPESNAILCYLADGTHLWPGDRLDAAGWRVPRCCSGCSSSSIPTSRTSRSRVSSRSS